MVTLKEEIISNRSTSFETSITSRIKVFGGWIVRTDIKTLRTSYIYTNNTCSPIEIPAVSTTSVFVPDESHSWSI